MKFNTKRFENLDFPKYDVINNVFFNLYNDLNNQIEYYFIEGLKRKGFEFENKIVLASFVKDHCICADNINIKQRTYYVDDVPFILHSYDSENIYEVKTINEVTKVVSDLGNFYYL